jgi:hypothetical protein
MIKQDDRDTVKAQMIDGDYQVAQKIYQKNTGRTISQTYLCMFITGRKPATGKRPGSHQPSDMYQAICEAIEERLEAQKRIDKLAKSIRASTIEAAQAAGIV